jgi:hypothetical protein
MLEIKVLGALGYEINNRKYSDVKPLFSEDYKQSISNCIDDSWVYSGTEHKQNPKLPNVTVLPHIYSGRNIVLGTTFGHTHIAEEAESRMFQEIYEFKGFGGMLTYNATSHPSEAILHVLKPGEKVGVTPQENMTLFNFDQEPLLTLDYADASRNQAHKNTEKKLGSLLMIECTPRQLPRREANPCGMILTSYDRSVDVSLKVNSEYAKNEIINASSDASVTLSEVQLGEGLYNALRESQRNIKSKTGLTLSFGGNLPQFPKPLLDYVLNRDKNFGGMLGLP